MLGDWMARPSCPAGRNALHEIRSGSVEAAEFEPSSTAKNAATFKQNLFPTMAPRDFYYAAFNDEAFD